MPLVPAGAVADFQLPPGNTQAPQGPVTPGEAPPRPVAAPAPTPRATPTPAPTPTPTVSAAPSSAAPVTVAPVQPAAPGARVGGSPSPTIPAPGPTPAATAGEPFDAFSQDRPPSAPSGTPDASATELPRSTIALPAWWPWAAGGVALLAALAGGALLWRRRRKDALLAAPLIERPRIVPHAAPPAPTPPPPPDAPADEDAPHGPLTIAVEARELTISLGAATLAYRITLTNTGTVPLSGVTIAGDMVSAHASLAAEEQLATAQCALAHQHDIARIKPGETVQVTGDFRLPFQSIRAIRKGTAAIFVPLARLRVETAEGGNGVLMRTALVGQRSPRPGAGLQPFRLDLGPRIYREVTQKIFS